MKGITTISKSNKELAVELYCAIIQAAAIVAANAEAPIKISTCETVADEVATLTELLSKIKD